MGKQLKHKIYLGLASISLIVASAGVGITFAKYNAVKDVSQIVGYQGKLNQASIFLNANVWEKDKAIYYIFMRDPVNQYLSPVRTINPTINNITFTMYVFVIENPEGKTFEFLRMNPDGANVPSYDTGSCWNHTDAITYSSSANYYCINTYDNGMGYHNSGYETPRLLDVNNNGDLYFAG